MMRNTGITKINNDSTGVSEDIETNKRCHNIIYVKINSIPGENYQTKLNYLNKCKCCERHTINKPNRFIPWKELPFNNKYGNMICECDCDCRHLARFICRQHKDYKERA